MSVFHNELHRAGPTVSYLLLECLEAKAADLADCAPEHRLNLLRAVVIEAGQLDPTEQSLLALTERLEAMRNSIPAPAAEPSKAPEIGKAVYSFLKGMEAQEQCFLLADGDIALARQLYCNEDIETVQALAQLRTKEEWYRFSALYEAIALAFGGKPQEEGNTTEVPQRIAASQAVASQESVDDMNSRLRRVFGRV